jgi:cation diffusion facilitator family transporter
MAMSPDSQQRAGAYRDIRRVTVVGAVVDLGLALAKFIGGVIVQSQALIADGIHSLSDLVTDGLVIIAARQASFEADREHPYGHGRIQTIATAILAISLGLIAAGIAFDAIRTIISSRIAASPGWPALVIAGISVVSKEAIYHYTMSAARRHRSALLEANAWHSRSDALSSFLVIAGVSGVMLGFPWADAAGAVGVSVIIFYAAYQIGRDSFEELIDTAVDPDIQVKIRQAAKAVPGVIDVHEMRTRRMGADIFADMHVRVRPRISVSEGHRVADEVMDRLKSEFPTLTDVVVHIDPEDDHEDLPLVPLQSREALESAVRVVLKRQRIPAGVDWDACAFRLTLHYLNGRLMGELVLPRVDGQSVDPLACATLAEDLVSSTALDQVDVLWMDS